MKDIDQLLRQKPQKPSRELSGNFTNKTISEVKSSAAPGGPLANVRDRILRHAWLSLAGFLLLGGTAAAAVALWPTPQVTPLISKQLPSGNHIVGYNAANCDYFSDLDGHNTPPSSDNVYYELRQGANISDQQLKDSLQAVCEENLANNAISRLENQLPKKGNSTMTYHIDSISQQKLTLSLDPHYDKTHIDIVSPMTYSRFSSDLFVYSENSKISFADLKPGDAIKLIYNDTTGQAQTPQNNYIDLNHPENIVISAILRVPPLTADPNAFYTHLGTDFVRVESCQSSPTGFCRAYDFSN
jgi:hypothetical protein